MLPMGLACMMGKYKEYVNEIDYCLLFEQLLLALFGIISTSTISVFSVSWFQAQRFWFLDDRCRRMLLFTLCPCLLVIILYIFFWHCIVCYVVYGVGVSSVDEVLWKDLQQV